MDIHWWVSQHKDTIRALSKVRLRSCGKPAGTASTLLNHPITNVLTITSCLPTVVGEPTHGAGVTGISCARALHHAGHNHQQTLRTTCTDIGGGGRSNQGRISIDYRMSAVDNWNRSGECTAERTFAGRNEGCYDRTGCGGCRHNRRGVLSVRTQ